MDDLNAKIDSMTTAPEPCHDTNTARKRILLFLAITFAISWIYEFAVVYPMNSGSLNAPQDVIAQLVVGAVMLVPALGVLLTRLITREGFRGTSLIAPVKFRKTWKIWLLGYLGPFVLMALGATLYYLVVPDAFDPAMGYAKSMMPQLADMDVVVQGIPLVIAAVLVAPLANIVTCFGEEWGWRGYLMPKLLERHSVVPTLLISGIIWGIWHAPLTILGHNYGLGYPGYPFAGILAMCCFCTVVGVFNSYVTLRSGSCIPAALAHGSLNGTASLSFAFASSAGNPFIGPGPWGIIGGAAFIAAALVIMLALRRREKRGEKLLESKM